MRENSNKILKWFLLVLFVGYYLNITLFYHVHLENGERIVHSHFVWGEEFGGSATQHSHSSATYSAIWSLANILLLLVSFAVLLEALRRLLVVFISRSLHLISFTPAAYCSLRAPPL